MTVLDQLNAEIGLAAFIRNVYILWATGFGLYGCFVLFLLTIEIPMIDDDKDLK